MEDKVKAFLNSGLLELYVYGELESNEVQEVENFINTYPTVKSAYISLQNELEQLQLANSVEPRIELKSEIIQSLPPREASNKVTTSGGWTKYATGLLLLSTIILSYLWYDTNRQIKEQKKFYTQELEACERNASLQQQYANSFLFINNQETKLHVMRGKEDFMASAYVNTASKQVYLKFNNPLDLPQNMCLQLWGDKDGEMLPLGVFHDQNSEFLAFTFDPQMESLNFTIEEKTKDGKGQDHPNVSQLVSSVSI